MMLVWESRVFPAYAGMSPPPLLPRVPRPGFPRLRGDEPATLDDWRVGVGFSPPTRG